MTLQCTTVTIEDEEHANAKLISKEESGHVQLIKKVLKKCLKQEHSEINSRKTERELKKSQPATYWSHLLSIFFFFIICLILIHVEVDLIMIKNNISKSSTTKTNKIERRESDNELAMSSDQSFDERDIATVIQFHGQIPFLNIENDGLIGPWERDETMRPSKNSVKLKDYYEFEITESGLYNIYVQIYYLTKHMSNSYSIHKVKPGFPDENELLTTCATQANLIEDSDEEHSYTNEVSCYTSVIKYLHKNDRIYINQIEQNRILHIEQGYSSVGFIRLQTAL